MSYSGSTENIAGRCHKCNRESAPANFCRWCGIHRSASAAASFDGYEATTALDEELPPMLSSVPLKAITQSVASKTGSLRLNRFGTLVIAALIAIPMWLLIILLSPFDAYLSARNAWARMVVR